MTQVPVSQPIDAAQVVLVYTGRPGCGCGCRGRYSSRRATINRVVRTMNERLAEMVVQPDGDGQIFSVEDETRYRWAYTSPGRAAD